MEKKKKFKFIKPLLMALILVFSLPFFALAATPDQVTYDTKGATTVPSQSAYDSFMNSYGKSNVYSYVSSEGGLVLLGVTDGGTLSLSADTVTATNGTIKKLDFYDVVSDSDTSFSRTGISLYSTGTPEPEPEPEPNPEPSEGGENMFTNLTATAILAESTTWANNFNGMLLVVVGVGIGFACVRFVKSLFF